MEEVYVYLYVCMYVCGFRTLLFIYRALVCFSKTTNKGMYGHGFWRGRVWTSLALSMVCRFPLCRKHPAPSGNSTKQRFQGRKEVAAFVTTPPRTIRPHSCTTRPQATLFFWTKSARAQCSPFGTSRYTYIQVCQTKKWPHGTALCERFVFPSVSMLFTPMRLHPDLFRCYPPPPPSSRCRTTRG